MRIYYGPIYLPDPPAHPAARALYFVGVACLAVAWFCLGLVALIFFVAVLGGLIGVW